MFSVPLFSRDVYAYIGQGRLMVEGFNPYENGISALSNYFQLGADKMWTEAPVPYGQLFLWIEQFVVWSTNVHPEGQHHAVPARGPGGRGALRDLRARNWPNCTASTRTGPCG